MVRGFFLVAIASGFTILAAAAEPCRILLVNGNGDSDTFSVTFMMRGRLAVRRLEFNCTRSGHPAKKSERDHCVERNASFLPGNQYTVQYTYPGGTPGTIIVSLRSALLNDGRVWKPGKNERCRVLHIHPRRKRN